MKTLRILAIAFVMAFAATAAHAQAIKPARVKMTPEARRDTAIARANAKYEAALAYQKMTPDEKLAFRIEKEKATLAKNEAKLEKASASK